MDFRTEISEETLQDLINIKTGLFYPLTGFMGQEETQSVIRDCTLPNGEVFPIPITMEVKKDIFNRVSEGDILLLAYQGEVLAKMTVESRFLMTDEMIGKIFQTTEETHPGVKKEKERGPWRVGGNPQLIRTEILADALKPEETKERFRRKGFQTVAGFQTRNPIHRAHEYIQRLGLELCDGLFINPIIGWKKKGDFTQEAVNAAYKAMIREFYPAERVHFGELKTQMRYAGPREAVFHAIIRRNLGCTHFIIGRDHAGVGGYYGAYDAHHFAKEIAKKHNLGIKLLLTREPYYCEKCGQIVTDKTCSHYDTYRKEISGTLIRRYIKDGTIPDEMMIRKEIFEAILSCKQIFVE